MTVNSLEAVTCRVDHLSMDAFHALVDAMTKAYSNLGTEMTLEHP